LKIDIRGDGAYEESLMLSPASLNFQLRFGQRLLSVGNNFAIKE
jgi:hypothetical protein